MANPAKTPAFPAPPTPAVKASTPQETAPPAVPQAAPPGGPVEPVTIPAPAPIVMEIKRIQINPLPEASAKGVPGRDPLKAEAKEDETIYIAISNIAGFYVGDTMTEADIHKRSPNATVADWISCGAIKVA